MSPRLLALFCLAVIRAAAQPAHLISPQVHPDRTVTFRLVAPHAQVVLLSREAAPADLPLLRQSDGSWAVTTPALEPDYYGYTFKVDGVTQIDPRNALVKANLLNLSNLVHVPGPAGTAWDEANVPHGVVHHHTYHSGVLGQESDFFVYTPPGYGGDAATRLPVLYLLHGYSDGAAGWTEVGRAQVILDNLIAQGKAKPMLVVMPFGYGNLAIIAPGPRKDLSDPDARDLNYRQFRSILLDEVIPRVEAGYATVADRRHRAIAGLSMGGAESLLVGLNTLDRFSWIGAFSTGGFPDDIAAAFPRLVAADNERLSLLWIACGAEDSRLDKTRELRAWLQKQGIPHTDIDTPGGHVWPVWRRNLTAFVPLLFRD